MITWFKNLFKKMFGPTQPINYIDDPVVYKDYVPEPAPAKVYVSEPVAEALVVAEPEPVAAFSAVAPAPVVEEPTTPVVAETAPAKVKKPRKAAEPKAVKAEAKTAKPKKAKADAASMTNVTDVTKKPRKKK